MLTINSLRFDTTGWQKSDQTPELIRWQSGAPELLSLHFFERAPDIGVALEQDALRQFYREAVASLGGAIVSVDTCYISNLLCFKNIIKLPQPERGMTYVGSITIPFLDRSYVIKIQCAEIGVTGERDATILQRLFDEGAVQLNEETQQLDGWFSDPYDKSFLAPVLRNRSDDEKYDAEFPGHPLSRTRLVLNSVSVSLEIDPELLTYPAFKSHT